MQNDTNDIAFNLGISVWSYRNFLPRHTYRCPHFLYLLNHQLSSRFQFNGLTMYRTNPHKAHKYQLQRSGHLWGGGREGMEEKGVQKTFDPP